MEGIVPDSLALRVNLSVGRAFSLTCDAGEQRHWEIRLRAYHGRCDAERSRFAVEVICSRAHGAFEFDALVMDRYLISAHSKVVRRDVVGKCSEHILALATRRHRTAWRERDGCRGTWVNPNAARGAFIAPYDEQDVVAACDGLRFIRLLQGHAVNEHLRAVCAANAQHAFGVAGFDMRHRLISCQHGAYRGHPANRDVDSR